MEDIKFSAYEIVTRMVGPTFPVGSHQEDVRRLENLRHLTGLVDEIVRDLCLISEDRNRRESSMKEIGQFADSFLGNLAEEIQGASHER